MVIAIIAILAAMLSPALAKAKAKAQANQCVSNVRQLSLATQMYGMDNEERLPDTGQNLSDPDICIPKIKPYLGSRDTTAATVGQLVVRDNGPGALTLATGGSLITGTIWTGIGYNNTGSLTLLSGSSAIFGEHLWVGFEPTGIGTLTLSGGTATVNGMFGLGWNGGTGSA